jgi:hypothetical protein
MLIINKTRFPISNDVSLGTKQVSSPSPFPNRVDLTREGESPAGRTYFFSEAFS